MCVVGGLSGVPSAQYFMVHRFPKINPWALEICSLQERWERLFILHPDTFCELLTFFIHYDDTDIKAIEEALTGGFEI